MIASTRKNWTAKDHAGSSTASLAIDGNTATVWSSGTGPDPWLQVDLGEPCPVAGFELFWGKWPATSYRIETSTDGKSWQPAFEAPFGEGAMDVWHFPQRLARHIRLTGLDIDRDHGMQIRDLEFLGPNLAPTTLDPEHTAALDGDYATGATVAAGSEIVIDLKRTREAMGMRIDWGQKWATHFSMHVSENGQDWTETGRIATGTGGYDSYWFPNRHVRYVKLAIHETTPGGAEVLEVKLRISSKSKTPLGPYEAVASKRRLGIYPTSLLMRQIYWTVVGARNDFDEVLFDEYGNLEPKLGGPSLMPYVLLAGTMLSPLDSKRCTHTLRQGSLPLPSVSWKAKGIDVTSHAGVRPTPGSPVALRHSLINTTKARVTGQFVLILRPIQINPVWQHGGHAPVHELLATNTDLVADGRLVVRSLATGTSTVTEFANGDVIDCLKGLREPVSCERSAQGTMSGALVLSFSLEPGEETHFDFWAPLSDQPLPTETVGETLAIAESEWRDALGPRRIELGDLDLAATAEAQVGYILVNQGEQCLQPGPRNYDRTWIRDGSVQALALMQAGLLGEAQRYVEWYAQRVAKDGAVPPILWGDGSYYGGYGADIEFDAQGQFIFAVAECYRYTRDREFLGRVWPVVQRCLSFLQELRERTIRDNPVDSRFYGLLAPSISHEGYSKPTHSSWDDFWGIRGWADGAFLAGEADDSKTQAWCLTQRNLLAESTKRALRLTMQLAGLSRIPSSADNADPDPTSTAIAYFPCDAADALPEEGLAPTYDGEIANIRAKNANRIKEMTTPYEMRCTNAFLGLGRIDEAHEVLDYFMSWRRPAGWRLWAEVILGDERFAQYIGDMPHTWIGAELYTIVRRCVAREVDGGIEFLSWAKRSWLSGLGVRLTQLPTHFGPVEFSARLKGHALHVTFPDQAWTAKPAFVRVKVPDAVKTVMVNRRLVIPEGEYVFLSP